MFTFAMIAAFVVDKTVAPPSSDQQDKQLSGWTPEEVFPVLRRAALWYRDATFTGRARKVPPLAPADRARLTNASRDK